MSDVLAIAIIGTIIIGILNLGVFIGDNAAMNKIKSDKLIIIDNSSYRCKMVKTLEEK